MSEPSHDELVAQAEAAIQQGRNPAPEQPAPEGEPEASPEAEAQDAPEGDAKPASEGEPDKKGEVPHKSWSAMFRREKRAREQEAANKAALERAETLEKQAQQRIADAEARLKELEADPYKFVEKHISFDDWAKRRLSTAQPTAEDRVKALEAEVQRLRDEPKRLIDEQSKAQQQAQLESTVTNWIARVPDVLKDDKYALIRDMQAQDELPALAAMELQRSGRWLTHTEAADRILAAAQQRLAQLAKAGHVSMQSARTEPRAETTEPQAPPGKTTQRHRPARAPREMTREQEIAELAKHMRYHET